MSEKWMLENLIKGQNKINFSANGMINWVRATSILCNDQKLFTTDLKNNSNCVLSCDFNDEQKKLIFKNFFFSMYEYTHLARLVHENIHPYDILTAALTSCYKSIIFAIKSMKLSNTECRYVSIEQLINFYQTELINKDILPIPFSIGFKDLTKKNTKDKIKSLKNNNSYNNNDYPKTKEMSWGASITFLNGTRDYIAERTEERLLNSSQFYEKNILNFRTKDAQSIRDKELALKSVNFLAQIHRVYSKVNSDEIVYIAYGGINPEKLKQFILDLKKIARTFQIISGRYISHKCSSQEWDCFIQDFEKNAAISLKVQHLKW
ncbi:hypothetical protein CF386_08570 [Paraphotobacterium marinum]|uniref:Uncharacterized protein n=1 Tax=Paraphotobacterium marinum TaxID=1755811 RepID=A0A220VFE6_9GAMM|nr:hypothetical protein [Paraphotobacterium marinum]ASK79114.1 hypothetical protein CF386_08570 [Paraphotobacterium marinum]